MNYYQENNVSVKYNVVKIVNVVFTVRVNSSIDHLITKLRVAYSELDSYITHSIDIENIKIKGIEINAIIKTLMNSNTEGNFEQQTLFIKNLIESSVIIVSKYEDATKLNEGFDNKLRNELANECCNYYDRNFGIHLNDTFWWNLYFYEWLEKEKLISSYHYEISKRVFTDEQLEKFFCDNRHEVLQRMLNCERDGSKVIIDSPLSNSNNKLYFDSYNMLPTKVI